MKRTPAEARRLTKDNQATTFAGQVADTFALARRTAWSYASRIPEPPRSPKVFGIWLGKTVATEDHDENDDVPGLIAEMYWDEFRGHWDVNHFFTTTFLNASEAPKAGTIVWMRHHDESLIPRKASNQTKKRRAAIPASGPSQVSPYHNYARTESKAPTPQPRRPRRTDARSRAGGGVLLARTGK